MRTIADSASAATKSARRQRERRPQSVEPTIEPGTGPRTNEAERNPAPPPERMFPNFEVWE
jgi:hypothetical protein